MTTATLPATILRVFDDTDSSAPRIESTDRVAIARELAAIGCRFERWEASVLLAPDADQATILAAYAGDVQRLIDESGYASFFMTQAGWVANFTGDPIAERFPKLP